MPFVLRKLDRKAAFHPINGIPTGDVQADALSDLRTTGNALSVWLIDDDRANLDRIVAALGAGRMELAKLDYALMDHVVLDDLRIQATPKHGLSIDAGANSLWHRDLLDLSGGKLLELAVIMQAQATFERVQKSELSTLIAQSLHNGFIDRDRLKEKLARALPGLDQTHMRAP